MIHRQSELIKDIDELGVSEELLKLWFHSRYSTSKHLLILYSLARGIGKGKFLEIGFGRSTFAFLLASIQSGSDFTCCDAVNYPSEIPCPEYDRMYFVHGNSAEIWNTSVRYDLMFLDYFSDQSMSMRACFWELVSALKHLNTHGILAIHDTFDHRYSVKKTIRLIAFLYRLDVVTLPFNYGLTLLTRKGVPNFGDPWEKA